MNLTEFLKAYPDFADHNVAIKAPNDDWLYRLGDDVSIFVEPDPDDPGQQILIFSLG